MPEGAHPKRHQREGDPRAADDLFRELARRARSVAPVAAAIALLAGCDVGDAQNQILDAPPPTVREIRATTSLDEDGLPVYEALAQDGTTQVLTGTSFRIRFDRFLLPETVTRQSICIQSKLDAVATLDDCREGIFLEPTYDPTRREATYRQRSDEPRLKPSTKYQVTVLPPGEGDLGGIRAFDGAALARPVAFQFSTVSADPPGSALETLPTGDVFCGPQDCFDRCAASKKVTSCQAACPADCSAPCKCDPMDPMCKDNCPMGDSDCRTACKMCRDCKESCLATCTASCPYSIVSALGACAFGGCHLDDKDPTTGAVRLGAAMGLDLSVEGIAMTAINRVAHQTQQGERADEPDKSSARFGRAMPIIDASGSAGRSYLLYKLLVGPSATGDTRAEDAEIARLRAALVVGMPMPPPPGGPLREVDLAALATWIVQGAPTPVCTKQ